MATTATAPRTTVKEYTFQWVGLDRNQREVRGETRAVSETVVTTNLRRQGIRVTKIKRQTLRGGRGDHAEGHHVLHPPAGDDAEGRRADAAGVRHRRPRPQQRAVRAADDAHQEQDRSGIEPVAGVPRASAAFRRALLQPGPRRRDVGDDRHDPRPARALPRKDPRDQEQDQERPVLPDLGDRGCHGRGVGDHGLGDSGVQAGVHELRRRSPGADADGDRHLRFRRQVVVARVHGHRRRHRLWAVLLPSIGGDSASASTACC